MTTAPSPRRHRAASFATLDEYLGYLRQQSTTDGSWYEQVVPGISVLRSMLPPSAGERRFTRSELMRELGFDR